jgi:hypothetical protein
MRALLIFAVTFFSYAYFYEGAGWNQNSRFDLVRAIVEQGTLRIDDFQQNTEDKAFANGHYYSDKAPGLALLAVPAARAGRVLLRIKGTDPASPRGLLDLAYWITVWAVALPMAAACACLFWITLQLGSSVGASAFAALALGLATPMWAYATLFWGHALAGACLVFAFACAMRLRGDVRSTADVLWGSALGLAAGWATVTEYPSAPASAMVAGFALALVWKDGWRRRSRIVLGIAAGALPCVIALMAYQEAAFGSVFHPSYAYYPPGAFSWMTHGYMGLTYPRIDVALKLLFSCRRGLLFSGPVALAAPFGLRLLWKQPATHAAAVSATAIAAYYFLFHASFSSWPAGWSYGPRYLSPGLPLLCVGLAPLVGSRAASLENRRGGAGCGWSGAYAHGAFGLGAASGRVSLPAASVLLAIILGGQIFLESRGRADSCRAGHGPGAWRIQPRTVGRTARLGEPVSVVGGVGSRGCSLGGNQSDRTTCLALECNCIRPVHLPGW